MKKLIVTAGIAIENNHVLIAKRKNGKSLSGFWEFPGGKLEDNESPKQCIERELKEELNVDAIASNDIFCRVSHRYEDFEIDLIAFEVKLSSHPKNSIDHDDLIWVKIDDLMNYKLTPADIPLAQKIMRSRHE